MCGGKRVVLKGKLKGGFYVEPTIIEGLSYDCNTNQEEIIGLQFVLIFCYIISLYHIEYRYFGLHGIVFV